MVRLCPGAHCHPLSWLSLLKHALRLLSLSHTLGPYCGPPGLPSQFILLLICNFPPCTPNHVSPTHFQGPAVLRPHTWTYCDDLAPLSLSFSHAYSPLCPSPYRLCSLGGPAILYLHLLSYDNTYIYLLCPLGGHAALSFLSHDNAYFLCSLGGPTALHQSLLSPDNTYLLCFLG